MFWMFVLSICTTLIVNYGESYSWYSTIGELGNLVKSDQNLVRDLRNTLKLGSATIKLLSTQIEGLMNFSKEHIQMLGELTSEEGPSVDYYQWYNQQISQLKRQVFLSNGTRLQTIYNDIRSFPDIKDLEVTHDVLLDLQKLNNLKAKDLAQGYIMDIISGYAISATSVYGLAERACSKLEQYSYTLCLEWCDEARLIASDPSAGFKEEDITGLAETRYEMRRYSELCAASVNQTYIENPSNPNLMCFIWDNNHHPLLVLQPVRAEMLSAAPAVVMFYDVISPKEIDNIIQEATSSLEKATTLALEETIQPDGARVAHNFWLEETDHEPLVKRIDLFADAVTRLSVKSRGEPLQVANYGVGGHYKPHHDSSSLLEQLEDPAFDIYRRATLMYYLSDVQRGGATAFPLIGIAARPVKGAAIFWYDLLWDGSVNVLGYHGACPVLLGNKWVANKWIHDGRNDKCYSHFYKA